MTLEEYAAAQQAIVAELLSDVLSTTESLRQPVMRHEDWNLLLRLLFFLVGPARERSARLARAFYDAQREEHHPDLPRHDQFLTEYRPEWFEEDMEPAREAFLQPGANENAVEQVGLRVAKAVENGARRQILRAVADDDPKVAKGWARVATGRETCGFCMMLVSRGPVYNDEDGGPRSAGLNVDHDAAVDLWNAIENARTPAERRKAEAEMDEMMTKWHPGCDCKVVPVFDRADWPGRDAYKRAEAIWARVTKGLKGRDALNAFRRAIESGEVDIREMSIAA